MRLFLRLFAHVFFSRVLWQSPFMLFMLLVGVVGWFDTTLPWWEYGLRMVIGLILVGGFMTFLACISGYISHKSTSE